MTSAYFNDLTATLKDVIARLAAKGIQPGYLAFGGEGKKSKRKPTAPTDARSEFLANRAMGDWAEQTLLSALAPALPEYKVVQYGVTNRIAAGHPEFKAHYHAGLEETRLFGKRPDLLLFPAACVVEADLSGRNHAETNAVVKNAVASIEVRSSKYEALKYMAVRKRQRASGQKSGRETPSFTVKVEDLLIVYRWLQINFVPQCYCQVFFDSVFAINFLDIFSIIASGTDFSIEKPKKSQEKWTIMIPLSRGLQVGDTTEMPTFAAEHRVTELGRHDAYVVPCGGSLVLNAARMRQVLLPR